MKTIRKTRSVCPRCLRGVSADIETDDGKKIYLVKRCPEHGRFSTLIWRGLSDYEFWRKGASGLQEDEGLNCSSCSGICSEHLQGSCCVLLEVTRRCNLSCRFCFAHDSAAEPSLAELKASVDYIFEHADPTVQLSGGEPTLRDDLPELISYIKTKGAKYVQLNSNGLRLAEDDAYVKRLAEAGLSFVFLQYDANDDAVYRKLRGRDLSDIKLKAIENCGKYGLGVTLVPTVVRGINDDKIGEIIRFAAFLSPVVRAVHFQPVSYFGKIPQLPAEEDRYTLDELIDALNSQAGIELSAIVPSRCDHPLCGFHAAFTVNEFEELEALTDNTGIDFNVMTQASQNRDYIGRHWSAAQQNDDGKNPVPGSLDYIAQQLGRHMFTVSAMAFQDAGNYDIERLRRCSLHVYKDGKLRPFCANYLTALSENNEISEEKK